MSTGRPSAPTSAPQRPAPRRRPPQFALLGLFTVTLVCSFTSAGAYYLVRSINGETDSQLIGMLFVLAGPMLLMVVVSLLIAFSRWWRG